MAEYWLMLKLPSGWAAILLVKPRIRAAMKVIINRERIILSPFLWWNRSHIGFSCFYFFDSLGSVVGEENMKVRVSCERALEKFFGLCQLTDPVVDHPGVVIQFGVLGSQPKRFFHGAASFIMLAVAIEIPR